MRVCTRCGSALDDNAKFCTICGQPVEVATVGQMKRRRTVAIVVAVAVLLALVASAIVVVMANPFGAVDRQQEEQSSAVVQVERTEGDSTAPTDDSQQSASEEDETQTDAATIQTKDGYVCPDSSTHVYTDSELYAMDAATLEIARNEIFARYGREFNNERLQSYFDAQPWYTRRYSPEEFDAMDNPLNATEKENVENMLRVQTDLEDRAGE